MDAVVYEAGVGFAGDDDAFLDDVGELEGGFDGFFPGVGFGLPAEDDAAPAVVVVGFEDEAVFVFDDEGDEVYGLILVVGDSFFDAACPGDVVVYGLALFLGEEAGVAAGAEDGEAGFFVEDFAAEGVDHADCAVAEGLDDRVVHAAAGDEFVYEDALVDEGDVVVAGDEAAVFVFDFAGVYDAGFEALGLEVVVEEDEFAVGGDIFPVHDGDAGGFLAEAAPVVVHFEEGVEDLVVGGEGADFVAAAEFAHDGEAPEDVGEGVVVGGGGGDFGVEFGEAEFVGFGDEEGVEAGEGDGFDVAGVDLDEFFFPVEEAELFAEGFVGDGDAVGFVEGAHEDFDALLEEGVLLGGEEAGAEDGAEEAVAEEEAAFALLFFELAVGDGGEVVG